MSGRGTPMNANHRRPAADEDKQEALSKQPPVTLSHSLTHTPQVGQCAALTPNDYILVYLYFEPVACNPSGNALAETYWSCLEEGGLLRKQVGITAIHSEANIHMAKVVEEKFTHVGIKWLANKDLHRCTGQLLNLIAKTFLGALVQLLDEDYSSFNLLAMRTDDVMSNGSPSV
ncbi:hypothetical protein PCANC_02848 [Puccinia coronata f. sp. avenae]|uniref:Uncharacterized protein n=1 Tax=Puccinia coronata f. sp. avenae TaxID=200324 RepID=A0A2N5W480_9BASI|nr:hypothetical protein PCANC_02848 [Puccinia coronata f. sp. avenae]